MVCPPVRGAADKGTGNTIAGLTMIQYARYRTMATLAYSEARARAEAPHPLPPFRFSPPATPVRTADARRRLIA